MNRLAARNLVIEATGRSDKVSLINSALDLAVGEVSSRHLWSDLFEEDSVALASGSVSVPLANDLARVTEVRVIENGGKPSWPLLVRKKTWIMQFTANAAAEAEGKPLYGYLEGKTLFVVPVPNDDFTIRYSYFRLHPALTADGSELLIRQADAAVIAYANYWVWQSLQNAVDADRWLQAYARDLSSAITVDKANSAVKMVADTRVGPAVIPSEFWNDPFVRTTP